MCTTCLWKQPVYAYSYISHVSLQLVRSSSLNIRIMTYSELWLSMTLTLELTNLTKTRFWDLPVKETYVVTFGYFFCILVLCINYTLTRLLQHAEMPTILLVNTTYVMAIVIVDKQIHPDLISIFNNNNADCTYTGYVDMLYAGHYIMLQWFEPEIGQDERKRQATTEGIERPNYSTEILIRW